MKQVFSFKICSAFLGVFLIGAVVGGLLVVNFSDQRFSKFLNRANDPASMTTRINSKLVSEYKLDQDQQNRIVPLTKEMAARLHQLRGQFGSDVIATMDAYHEKVAAVMTPEQREGYEKMNVERHSRATSMLFPDVKQN